MFSCFADGYITEQKRRQALNGDIRCECEHFRHPQIMP